MSRSVAHSAGPDGRSCACGARFKTAAKLRRHLAGGKRNPDREVWISTELPRQPRRKAKHS